MKAHRNSPIPFLDLYFVALAVCFLLKLNNGLALSDLQVSEVAVDIACLHEGQIDPSSG